MADLGRLAQTVDATSEPLRELWDATVIPAAAGYGIQTFPNSTIATALNSTDSSFGLVNAPGTPYNSSAANTAVTATLPCGWRGPYLQLPVASGGKLLDGWGNSFDSLFQAPAPGFALTTMVVNGPSNLVGTPIQVVRSRGADGVVDTTAPPAGTMAYNADQYVPSQTTLPPTTPLVTFAGRVLGSVPVAVKTIATTGGASTLANASSFTDSNGTCTAVRVAVFTPVNGVLQALILDSSNVAATGSPTTDLMNFTAKSNAAMAFTVGAAATPVAGSFLNVTTGPRAVQAYQYDPSRLTVGKRSPLTYLMVPAGGVPTQTLVLQ